MAKFRGAVLSCRTCGKEFKVPPSRAKKAHYCSNECAGVGRGADREIPRAVITCKWCGKAFLEHACHADRRKYCSNECRYADPDYSVGLSYRTTRERNPAWSGGTTKHSDGYVYECCADHPFTAFGYVLQHRLVVERHLRETFPDSPCLIKVKGRLCLDPSLSVHHVNFDKTDNRIENLQVMSAGDHQKLHNAIRRKSVKEKNI